MGFLIPCPNCGLRDVYEFKFGAEVKKEPASDVTLEQWRDYLYFNENLSGIHDEWWYNSAGCGSWFKIKRNTQTNEIIEE